MGMAHLWRGSSGIGGCAGACVVSGAIGGAVAVAIAGTAGAAALPRTPQHPLTAL